MTRVNLKMAVSFVCVSAVRRERAHLGREVGEESANAAGALGPGYRRALQQGRIAHRVGELRRARSHMGHRIGTVPQDAHRHASPLTPTHPHPLTPHSTLHTPLLTHSSL